MITTSCQASNSYDTQSLYFITNRLWYLQDLACACEDEQMLDWFGAQLKQMLTYHKQRIYSDARLLRQAKGIKYDNMIALIQRIIDNDLQNEGLI